MTHPKQLGINYKYMPKVFERLEVDTALYNAATTRFEAIKAKVFDSKFVPGWKCRNHGEKDDEAHAG